MGSIMDQERPWERDDWPEVSRKQAQESKKSREKLQRELMERVFGEKNDE